MPPIRSARPSGHWQVHDTHAGRVVYTLWRDAQGRHKRPLGPAWMRPSGKRTPRGAIVWQAQAGARPAPEHLTPADADQRLREILVEAGRLAPVDASRSPVTFGESCAEWLRYVEHDRQRAPSTVRDYRNTVRRYLLPALGADTLLAELSTGDVDAYREHELAAGGLARRTLQKILTILHGILARAVRKGWVATYVASSAERVTVQRSGDFNVLSPEKVAAAARAAGDPQLAAVIVVAAFTGLRMGELRALRWGDLDFAKRTVIVRRSHGAGGFRVPKSGRVRSVPLVDQAAAALDAQSRREWLVAAGDLVFASPFGTPRSDGELRSGFYRALRAAGLGHLRHGETPFRFHDLRHTFGTLAVQVFPISDVMAYMGHAQIQTTMIYVHHVPRTAAADRLSRALRADATPASALLTPS